MKNAKFNIACASFGFLLSLVVGIITRASFGVLLLRAFIFALVFAAVSFGLQVVFKTLFSAEESGDTLAQQDDGGRSGSVVNITLPEEDLPMENNAQRFFVGENHQMLNEGDYGHSINGNVAVPTVEHTTNAPQHIDVTTGDVATEIDAASPRFASGDDVPVATTSAPASTPSGNVSSDADTRQTSSQPSGFTAAPLQSVAQSSSSGGLDSLPDLSGLGEVSVSSSASESAPSASAAPSSPVRSASASAVSAKVNISDAALMAKAISTALSSDSD